MSIWPGRVASIWIKGEAGSRDFIEREWPELAEALDMLMLSTYISEASKNIEAAMGDADAAIQDILKSPERNEKCDGCKSIERMRKALKPGDEDSHYQFERAARHHRKECPNK